MADSSTLDPVLRTEVRSPTMPAALPPRLPDWPERLADYIEQRRHSTFAWGTNDCATFAAGAVSAMTGARRSALLPAAWGNVHEAERVLRDLAGLEAAAIRMLGEPVRGDLAACMPRGSVVSVRLDGRPTLGVLVSGAAWCAPGERSLVFRPAAEVRMGWKV